MTWAQALLPLTGLLADVLLFCALARRGRPVLKSVYAGFFCGFAFVLCAGLQDGACAAQVAADLLCYCTLGYGFFHFVNMGHTARRIRLLRELAEAGPLTRAELLARYGAREIVDVRLERLLKSGQARLENGRYIQAGGAVLFMSRALGALKRILLGRNLAEEP